MEHAPLLADLLAVSTDRGLERVALQIVQVVKPEALEQLPSKTSSSLERESSRAKRALERPESWIGTRISTYEIREFIGAGGSGIVFRAYSDSAKDVAIKLLYPLKSSLQKFTSVFTRGFRALAALQHPNIARLIELVETTVGGKKTFALCYEYIDGENLQSWSRKLENREDALRARLDQAVELADALRAAHETAYVDEFGFQVQGVLHGDIKPANVLVSADNRIKLVDFMLLDIQRLLDPNAVPHRLLEGDNPTPVTAAMGTPGFMAPEQEHKGILSIQTDVYALGVTFCYLFFPSAGDPLFSLLRKPDLPSDLRMLIISMTNGSPKGRPENMMEVSSALREIEKKI
jgi:serine/threonine protein kinase